MIQWLCSESREGSNTEEALKKAEKGVGVYREEEQQHGKKPSQIINDETFTKFFQRAKHKIWSMTNIGPHVENKNPLAAQDVVDSKNKENERDQFSHSILNTRKKWRTVLIT
jgi:hypothetical protein